VTNNGQNTSGPLTAGLTGANAGEFGITADTCNGQTLAASATCTVSVRFTPTSAGVKAASLGISGTPGGSTSSALTGTATNPPPPATTSAETGQRAAALAKCKKKKKKLDWSKKRYKKCKKQANLLPV
jgi:hypothetical protein